MRENYKALFLLMGALLIGHAQAAEGALGDDYGITKTGAGYEVCMPDKDEIKKSRTPPTDRLQDFNPYHSLAKHVKSAHPDCMSTYQENGLISLLLDASGPIQTPNHATSFETISNSCSCGCKQNEVFDQYSGTCSKLTENNIVDWDYLPFAKGKASYPGRAAVDGQEDEVDSSRKTDSENGFSCSTGCIACCEVRKANGEEIKTRCKTCDLGYTLIDDECSKCAVNNCESCNGDVDACAACKDGYHSADDDDEPVMPASLKKCVPCPAGCKKCKVITSGGASVVQCLSCDAGYYLLRLPPSFDRLAHLLSHEANARCLKPQSTCDVENCELCRHSSDDSRGAPDKICGRCKDGYTVYDGKCRQCPDNCNHCLAEEGRVYCLLCMENHGLVRSEHSDHSHGCAPCQKPAESNSVNSQVFWQFFVALFFSTFLTNQ